MVQIYSPLAIVLAIAVLGLFYLLILVELAELAGLAAPVALVTAFSRKKIDFD